MVKAREGAVRWVYGLLLALSLLSPFYWQIHNETRAVIEIGVNIQILPIIGLIPSPRPDRTVAGMEFSTIPTVLGKVLSLAPPHFHVFPSFFILARRLSASAVAPRLVEKQSLSG